MTSNKYKYIISMPAHTKKHPAQKRISSLATLSAICLMLLTLFLVSCKKYLDEKPNPKIVAVSSLTDLQYVLDNDLKMLNRYYANAVIAADEYYLTDAAWAAIVLDEQPLYIWDYYGIGGEWGFAYMVVFNANLVLEELEKMGRTEANHSIYDNIRGQALFFRSFAFQRLAQLFCKPYSSTAATDLGIAIRLHSDPEETSVRGTVQQTYNQIINDLKEATSLLPENNIAISRPNKTAAFAALARTCLSMRDYANAGHYADSSLVRQSTLMDYNMITPGFRSISEFNPENIFLSYMAVQSIGAFVPNITIIDSLLYQSYAADDLRKTVFFAPSPTGTGYYFQGHYGVSIYGGLFCGLATDEMYLIRAESAARTGLADSAMADLNRLMIKRWKNNGSWAPFIAANADDALNKILIERKKELVFRGLRWSDLRRLNLEGAGITLTRILNGVTYTLPPNDLRWVMLIPLQEISLSGMQQNLR